MMHDIEYTCKIQWYTTWMLIKSKLGIEVFIILNVVKIMLCISDAQYYIQVKLCRTADSMHLCKMTGKLIPEHVKLKTIYHGMS